MTRRVGLPNPKLVKAADQLARSYPPAAGVQPLPAGRPGRVPGERVGIKDPGATIRFLVIGDTGGVKDPRPQQAVATALAAALASPATPSFIWHVGDIVYFNGDQSEYPAQFYEPYAHLQTPIIGVPGNHDGDTTDDPSRAPLDTFMANFCSAAPAQPAADPQDEFGRDTQTQPYCDWTLTLAAVTIIGLYSNVPSGGRLEQSQTDWLVEELKAAPTDRALVVSLHHPPYSVDAHHGGSATMLDALEGAFKTAGRTPELVLSGHVHDYQRFTDVIIPTQPPVTYLVIGNSGYHVRHPLAGDAAPGMNLGGGVTFEAGDDKGWGYVDLTIGSDAIVGSYVQAATPAGATARVLDNFTIKVGA